MDKNNEKKYNIDTEKIKISQKNFKEKGWLGVTSNDHKNIGSTAEKILLENPGKTLGELMTDEEIEEYIKDSKNAILKIESENVDDNTSENAKYINNLFRESYEASIKYLKDIGRLPKNFI